MSPKECLGWILNKFRPKNLSEIKVTKLKGRDYRNFRILTIVGTMFVFSVIKVAGVVPLPWTDEVFYADPVFNMANGDGFTSSVWYSQPYGEIWSSNSPIYAFIAYPALEIFGTSLQVWRGFWSVSFVLSVISIVYSFRRLGVIRSPISILLVGITFIFARTTSYLPVYGRGIDVACLILVALAVYSVAHFSSKWKVISLFVCGVAIPATGLQLVPSAAAVVLCFMFVQWRAALCAGLWLVAGITTGTAVIVLIYGLVGQAYVFLAMTFASGFTTIGSVAQTVIASGGEQFTLSRYDILHHYARMFGWDISILTAMLASYVSAFVSIIYDGKNKRKVIVLAMVGSILVPIAMIIAGRFARYYYWMAFLPSVVAIAATGKKNINKYYIKTLLLSGLVAVSIISGFAKNVYQKYSNNKVWSERIKKLVNENVASEDTVMASPVAYFETKDSAKMTYGSMYSGGGTFRKMEHKAKNSIKKLVVKKTKKKEMLESKIGGSWLLVDSCKYGNAKNKTLYVFKRNIEK